MKLDHRNLPYIAIKFINENISLKAKYNRLLQRLTDWFELFIVRFRADSTDQ